MEVLAVVWATKHFHHYIYGYPCMLFMDSQAVKSLLKMPHPSSRLARMGLALQDMDLTFEYRPGWTNQNADTLSRNPQPQEPQKTKGDALASAYFTEGSMPYVQRIVHTGVSTPQLDMWEVGACAKIIFLL